jgi:adenylate cyclase
MLEQNMNLFQNMAALIEKGIDPTSCEELLWNRYGETVATLVLDTTGFSRVTESHGIVHFLSRLMQLRALCQPIFEQHNSKRFHFHADNGFAIFPNIDDAIKSATAVHEAVYTAGLLLTNEERFRVSIGLGYGKMLYSETLEGYFSEEMNFASKLGEDIAAGDETLITKNAYNNADKNLLGDFSESETCISGLDLRYYRQLFSPA